MIMYTKRALFLNDLKFNEQLYFLYDDENDRYVLNTAQDIFYPREVVEQEEDFMMYEVDINDASRDIRITKNFKERITRERVL